LTDFLALLAAKHSELLRLFIDHMNMTTMAVFISLSIGIPVGIVITHSRLATRIVIGLANIMQSIPCIALLAFSVPFVGIGAKPAIMMVIIYALLPIIKNTYTDINDPETIFGRILTSVLNPWFSGVMLAGLMALIMSTVDSCLLCAASTLSEDFYHTCINRNASKEHLLRVSRLSVLLIALLGTILALNSGGRSVMSAMLFASGGLAATFGPTLLLSLYWKRLTEAGLIAAMLTGFSASVAWKVGGMAKISSIHESCFGFFAALVLGTVISLITKPLPQEEIARELQIISRDYRVEQLSEIERGFQSAQ